MNVKDRRKKKLIRLKASKNTILFLAVTFCGILLDLLTKWIVFANFKDSGRFVIIKDFLGIVCSENEGIVFGFAQGRNNILISFCLASYRCYPVVLQKLRQVRITSQHCFWYDTFRRYREFMGQDFPSSC